MGLLDAPVSLAALGKMASGYYYFTNNILSATSTASNLGVGTLRLAPWYVPNPITINRIGTEVTSAGESGAKVRLGIYSSDSNGFPSALVLDAGTINGDSNTVQEITVSQALARGLYWIGGAVQVVVTTQPTMRTSNASPAFALPAGTSTPSANAAAAAFFQTAVTGALPPTFTAVTTASTWAPRTFVKVA